MPPMITGIFRWRCKCGIGVKVLTETEKPRINDGCSLEVDCPHCGERQLIYAHRIVQVTTAPPESYLKTPA